MRKAQDSSKGTIILETSIVIPIFMMVILVIYGLFSVVSAQNQMTHALIQTSKSLSLDPYITEHVESAGEANKFWSGLGDIILDFVRIGNDKHFSSSSSWYSGKGDDSLAKDRFVGFFAGGDEAAADERLTNLKIVDGLDGVDVKMVISGDDMTITVKYEVQFWFDAFDLGKIPMEHSVTTKLWKKGAELNTDYTVDTTSSEESEGVPGSGGGGIR